VGDLKPGDKVQVTGPVGKSFLLPQDKDANLIMVATGTGIAPFRAFLKTRYERRAGEAGQTYLFYGAQHNCDFLYQDWLEGLSKTEDTFHLHTAFSREQCTETGQRLYVQHRIFKHRKEVFELLQQANTVFYMCGLRGMEEGVLQAFETAATECGLDWSTLFAQLKAEHRWHVEVY
jgi:ferredoxin--NADP+ reductase